MQKKYSSFKVTHHFTFIVYLYWNSIFENKSGFSWFKMHKSHFTFIVYLYWNNSFQSFVPRRTIL